ncbi:hypothetical protein [Nonomuraea roseoviolacea]|uniref:Uncharacterized protein n=1 Tax=Nonomuraea roseoviolacea subsp. carminata TaxID=160689 RepID=A0ABT1KF98_9ACTN|nr:hypothetical protein [Nonomuraea roseoviolacea]MCP2352696.1 hypothetical protein [Nonomuraea roseoviolacea subsp. carminata]
MRTAAAPKVFVGDLAPEELDEIGPDAAPQRPAPESWTRDEYRAWMLQSGITEVEGGLGIESFLDLAESVGLLEKRPNTAVLEPVSAATIALCRVVPLLRSELTPQLHTGGLADDEPLRGKPPHLVVYADGGWRVATISIGPRSGSYLVELAQWGEDNEPRLDKVEVIPGDCPERVASLLPGYRRSQS